MAECSNLQRPTDIQQRHVFLLPESLAAMRVADKADVIMVCGDKEFYAHKVVLEANSPYFMTMFHSNLEEAKSGKIVFSAMEPETLEAILDFLYLGDVNKMNSYDQLVKVLEASHLLELHELFQYCCIPLSQMLTSGNFLALWTLAEKYEAHRILTKVKSYFLENCTEVLTTNDFLTATVHQLKDLIVFFKSKFRNIDRILKGIVLWVLHDLAEREQFVSELFTYIDANRLSKQFPKSLLDYSELIGNSKELAQRLKDLVIEICFIKETELVEEEEIEPTESDTIRLKLCGQKLLFLAQRSVVNHVDEQGKGQVRVENFATSIQLFELDSLKWQPMTQVAFVNFKVEALCQWNECFDCVFMVGSNAGNVYVLYDIEKNGLHCVETTNNPTPPNASACYFRTALDCNDELYTISVYVVGGSASDGTASSAPVCLINGKTWHKVSPLNFSRNNPVAFTIEKRLFVTGGASSLSKHLIEYTDGVVDIEYEEEYLRVCWTVIELPNNFVNADAHFFPYNKHLCGVYNFDDVIIKLTYDDGGIWNVEHFPKNPLHRKLKVKRICNFPTENNSFVFMSTSNNNIDIPDYELDLKSLEWTKLPEPRGVLQISECGQLIKTVALIKLL